MAFEGSTAFITGGGSGLGRAFCEELGRRRARIFLTDIDMDGARDTARLVEAAGGEARVAEADVRDAERMREVVDEAYAWLGEVDLCINNAGVGVAGPFEDVSLEDFRFCIDINLWGVIYGCQLFVPRMKRRGSGYIINVASSAGLLSAPGMGPYNVSKAGVVALTETLWAELRGTGVKINALCPTFFTTNILETSRGVEDPKARKAAKKLMERSKVQAPDVARAALAAVYEGELYSIPMRDGRMFWRLKRLTPMGFRNLAAGFREGGVIDKLMRRG